MTNNKLNEKRIKKIILFFFFLLLFCYVPYLALFQPRSSYKFANSIPPLSSATTLEHFNGYGFTKEFTVLYNIADNGPYNTYEIYKVPSNTSWRMIDSHYSDVFKNDPLERTDIASNNENAAVDFLVAQWTRDGMRQREQVVIALIEKNDRLYLMVVTSYTV